MEEQSNNEDVGTVLLMLDNKCLPPCYCFETDSREVRSISPEILDEALEWVSQFKPSPPSIMYMVGAPQELDKEVQEVLEDVAGSVICAPMQAAEQEKAGLPFSRTQMVVFPSLADFERDNELVKGRSCVVHIGREEISRWSRAVKVQPTETRMRFRPRNLHRWDQSNLKVYKDQLLEIEAIKYHLKAAGVKVAWELSSPIRCPAMRTMVTIGPDGLCYPCPTFYYAGQTNGLGAIKTLTSDSVFSQESKQTCRLCQSEHCEACLFCELGHATKGEVTICELPKGTDGDTSWEEIIWLKDQSGYMFESFKSVSIKKKTEKEEKGLWASEQVDDISFEDFVCALQAINQTAQALIKRTPEVSENFISQYEKLVESAQKTHKKLFSYEQFTKSLEEIHLKGEGVTEEEAQGYDSVISQFKQSVKSEQVSRKVFFFEKVNEVLAGLVELSETANRPQLRWKRTLPVGNGISGDEEEDETGILLLSEYEVTSIRQLYETFLGWHFLYNGLTTELKNGFAVDKEMIEAAQREMFEAKAQIHRWFHHKHTQHNWEYRDGYNIAVDFESNINVSSAYYRKESYRDPELEYKDWVPVMQLDGIEKDVNERLRMLVETSLTEVKEYLVQYLAGLDVERDLIAAVNTLGHHSLDMTRWYTGMAREHHWSQYSEWRVNPDWIVEGR